MEVLGLILMGGLLVAAMLGLLFSIVGSIALAIVGLGFAKAAWTRLSTRPKSRLGRALLLLMVLCLGVTLLLAMMGVIARSALFAALNHLVG